MMQQLGVMLCKEREKMGEKQKSVAEGIISISDLCKVENGAMEVDYFTLQALFERLGKSIDKLELTISCDEYESIAYRAEIERSIEEWDQDKLEKLISGYDICNEKKRPTIHKQYKIVLQAIVQYMKKWDYASCLQGMEQALAYSRHDDWRQKARSGLCLCNQEIRIILMITYCQWKLGNTDGLVGQMEQLGGYILSHYTDTEEQVKVYPHCMWLLGQFYLEQNRVEAAYATCGKGKASLIENGSLNPLWEILELEEACLEKMGRQAELIQCRKYQEAVAFLYEAAGARPVSNMIAVFLKSSFQGEFVLSNELVRDLRESSGLTQEKFGADICARETLSRIESGKSKPNRKNLYQLLKRMGLERENYYGFIEADDYELYEKVRQYNRGFSKGRLKEAAKLLDEIENGIDMTVPVNRQFVGMGRITEQIAQGTLSRKQASQQYKELLALTMPPMDSGTMIYRVPFRTEYVLWNKIAVNLRRDGKVEEALQIYEQLIKRYHRSRVAMRYHAVPGFSLYINYTGFLEVHNELEKSREIGEEGLRHCLACCRGDMAGDILANLSLVYGKQGLPDVEETYLRYGYFLKDLYKREESLTILQKAYWDRFHRDID
ncbi:MAG: helix-turn-helix domain-containing protein [Lachnospiraceae bacterium]|nr:helix-turn-helix domain-containing protein [Lachnospiraceae bacterium]